MSESKPVSKSGPESGPKAVKKPAPKNFWLFIIAGVLELVVGLILSVIVGLSHSWGYGMILGMGFFVSANLMFMLAIKKLD